MFTIRETYFLDQFHTDNSVTNVDTENNLQSEPPDRTVNRAKNDAIVSSMRWREAERAWDLLDFKQLGYMTVADAFDRVAYITKENVQAGKILYIMVLDFLHFVSDRGLIERNTFVDYVFSEMNKNFGMPPYSTLRYSKNPLHLAVKKGESWTLTSSIPFYNESCSGDTVKNLGRKKSDDACFRRSIERPSGNYQYGTRKLRRRSEIENEKKQKEAIELVHCTYTPKLCPIPAYLKDWRLVQQDRKRQLSRNAMYMIENPNTHPSRCPCGQVLLKGPDTVDPVCAYVIHRTSK